MIVHSREAPLGLHQRFALKPLENDFFPPTIWVVETKY